MISQRISATNGAIAHAEPNRRQQLALERIEFAVGELASVLLSSCRSADIARAAVRDIRKAMAPIHAEILDAD
jgi:hypothetical protein